MIRLQFIAFFRRTNCVEKVKYSNFQKRKQKEATYNSYSILIKESKNITYLWALFPPGNRTGFFFMNIQFLNKIIMSFTNSLQE